MFQTTSVASILSVYSKVINKLVAHKSTMANHTKEIERKEVRLAKDKRVCISEVAKAEKAIEGFKALVGDIA